MRSFLETVRLAAVPALLVAVVAIALRYTQEPPTPKHSQSRPGATEIERCANDCRAASCERWDSCDQLASPLDCKTAVLRLERLCVRRCSPSAAAPRPFLSVPDRWRWWPI